MNLRATTDVPKQIQDEGLTCVCFCDGLSSLDTQNLAIEAMANACLPILQCPGRPPESTAQEPPPHRPHTLTSAGAAQPPSIEYTRARSPAGPGSAMHLPCAPQRLTPTWPTTSNGTNAARRLEHTRKQSQQATCSRPIPWTHTQADLPCAAIVHIPQSCSFGTMSKSSTNLTKPNKAQVMTILYLRSSMSALPAFLAPFGCLQQPLPSSRPPRQQYADWGTSLQFSVVTAHIKASRSKEPSLPACTAREYVLIVRWATSINQTINAEIRCLEGQGNMGP